MTTSDKKPVLVAVDLGEHTDAILRQASLLAQERQAPLVVGYVLHELYAVHPLFPQYNLPDAFSLATVERKAALAVADRAAAATGRTTDGFEVKVTSRSAHTGILEIADDIGAGLIVLGAHAGGLEGMLGNVTRQVVRHANADVWVVRTRSIDNPGPVIVATDFSEYSRAAIGRGQIERKRLGRSLVLLYCMDFVPQRILLPFIDTPLPSAGDVDRVRGELGKALDEEARGAEAEPVLKTGPAVEAITETAKERNSPLVIVGTHGRTGIGRLALGSVAEKVVEKATCSVLVARTAPARAGTGTSLDNSGRITDAPRHAVEGPDRRR